MNIYDIAKAAGVSIATVSRVLNRSSSVSPATRKKVMNIMRELDYTPNVFARSLGMQSMKMIGLLCTDVADLYYAKAVSVIQRLFHEDQYDVLLYCTGESRKAKKTCIKRLLEKQVDAIIAIGSAFKSNLTDADLRPACAKVPLVLINAESSQENVYSVLCDERTATYHCVELLYRAGHKNMLYLYDSDSDSGKAKCQGFLEAVSAFEIQETCVAHKISRSIEAACSAYDKLKSKHPGLTAVLTSEDLLAAGVLQSASYRVETPAVIGFDNSFIAQCTIPTLSSVDNMVEALSAHSVSLLTTIFRGEQVAQRNILSPSIVFRESFVPENK